MTLTLCAGVLVLKYNKFLYVFCNHTHIALGSSVSAFPLVHFCYRIIVPFQARYRPMYCGATENEMALADLKRALALRPDDKIIRREYHQLKGELDNQRVKDTKQFGGLFERGQIVEEGSETAAAAARGGGEASGRMTVEEALSSLKDAESACKVCARTA